MFLFSEPVDFSKNESTATTASTTAAMGGNVHDSDGTYSLYAVTMNNSSKLNKSFGLLRSISSDDLVLNSSDEHTDDESDVDIIGDPKGYLT